MKVLKNKTLNQNKKIDLNRCVFICLVPRCRRVFTGLGAVQTVSKYGLHPKEG